MAVHAVMDLKTRYPEFVPNKRHMLQLLLTPNCLEVTRNCLAGKLTPLLYLSENDFVSSF